MGSIPAILGILLSLKKSSIRHKTLTTTLKKVKLRKPIFYRSSHSTRGRFFAKLSRYTNSSLGPSPKLLISKLPLRCNSKISDKLFFRFMPQSRVMKGPSHLNISGLNSFWFAKAPLPLTYVNKKDVSQSSSPNTRYTPSMLFPTTSCAVLTANFYPKLDALTATRLPQITFFQKPVSWLKLLTLQDAVSDGLALGSRVVLKPILSLLAREWAEFLRTRLMLQFKRGLTVGNVKIKKASRQYFSFHNYFNSSKLLFSGRVKLIVPVATLNLRGSFWGSSELTRVLPCPVIATPQYRTAPQSTKQYRIPRLLDSASSATDLVKRRHLGLRTISKSSKLSSPTLVVSKKSKSKLKLRTKLFRKLKSRIRKLSRYVRFRLGRTRWFSVRQFKRSKWIIRRLTRRSRGLSRRLNRYKAFARLLRRRNRQFHRFKMNSLNLSHKKLIAVHPRGFYTPHRSFRAKIQRINSRNFSQIRGRFLSAFVHTKLTMGNANPDLPTRLPNFPKSNSQQVPQGFTGNWALNTSTLSEFWTNPTLLKYFLATESKVQPGTNPLKLSILQAQHQLHSYIFPSNNNKIVRSNLWLVPSSNYTLRRKLLRSTFSYLFSFNLSMWYYKSLISFIESCSGRKVSLHFGPFLEGALTFEDKARCVLWGNRVMGFQRILGHKIFVQEALMLVALSLRLKDTTFLANWIRGMLKRMSFWKYRLLFRYLKFLFQHIFRPNFGLFNFRGLKLRLKGKISVAGNARTRTLFYRVGDTSHSKMNNKVSYDLSYVNTFTGVMGFKLWFFY